MRLRLPAVILPLVITLGVAFAGCSAETSPEQPTLRMAITEVQGLEELQREYGAFKTRLEEVSGLEVEFFPVTTRTSAAVALNADQVDLVFTGPAEYVALNARTEAAPVVSITRPGYRSVLYTTAASDIQSVSQLRGHAVAMDDVGSTSGHLGPAWMLSEAGLDPLKDVKILNVGDSAHQALKRGDAAAVGIVYYAFEDYTAKDDPAMYRVLEEGDPLPPDVIMARKDLDPVVRDKVKRAFMMSWDRLLPALLESKLNARYNGATVIETDDSDYEIVRKMYQAVGVDDFANTPE